MRNGITNYRNNTFGRPPLSEVKKVQIWNAMRSAPFFPLADWRYDAYGGLVRWQEYGRTSRYGWEIDHKFPKSRGGGDELSNLQGLHWSNNRQKSDSLTSNLWRLLEERP